MGFARQQMGVYLQGELGGELQERKGLDCDPLATEGATRMHLPPSSSARSEPSSRVPHSASMGPRSLRISETVGSTPFVNSDTLKWLSGKRPCCSVA
jgi:hypothetical protein